MAKELNGYLGDMSFDGLITGLTPPVTVGGGTIPAGDAETEYVRGTVFQRSSTDGTLAIFGSVDNSSAASWGADTVCVLCDNITVGTENAENVSVYETGVFDPDKLTVKDGYTITDADVAEFKKNGIFLKSPLPEI